MVHRIHVLGASGSGSTTLGAELASVLGGRHFDADNYYWKPTQPPYQVARDRVERVQMLASDLAAEPSWTLSGSMCGWGDSLIPRITLVVFVYLDQGTRMQRLLARERARYGNAIEPGGEMRAHHIQFMEWAQSYDTAAPPVRGLQLHEAWLSALPCPVLRICTDKPSGMLADDVIRAASLNR